MKNKKADIGIMILVLGVIILCGVALISFNSVQKKQETGGIGSVVYLQNVYNIVESFRFSGAEFVGEYEGINREGEGFVINQEFEKDGEVFLKVNYKFDIDDGGVEE